MLIANGFIAGVLATLFVELLLFFIGVLYLAHKFNKEAELEQDIINTANTVFEEDEV